MDKIRQGSNYSTGMRHGGPRPPTEVEELRRSLISTIVLLVQAHLGSDDDRFAEAREVVRYGQLLASRCNPNPATVDKVVMAGWLSALSHRREVIKQLVTPYDLEEIIFPGEKPSAESSMLNLIRTFQELKKTDVEVCRDVNLIRRTLGIRWTPPHQHKAFLEIFLQVLMDEEFLTKLDRQAGVIVIADPNEQSKAGIAPPLMNSGYDVHVLPSAAAVEEFMVKTMPDVIIAAADLPDGGVRFFQKTKTAQKTSDVPLLALIAEGKDRSASQYLRAGADDFIAAPVDLELLFAKIEKLMSRSPRAATHKGGVSGSLSEINFTDMVQIVCAAGRNMELKLVRAGKEAVIFFQSGLIIHAETEGLRGEEAFYKIMQWNEGTFTTSQCSDYPPRSITASTMSLLMEGARLADEGALK